MPKMLDLFCGTKSMANAFKRAGWETYTVDWEEKFEPTLCCDVNTLTIDKIIELCGGKPDFVHLSPDCSSYSVAAIFHHRRKNEETGELEPITDYAKFCDKTNAYIIDLKEGKIPNRKVGLYLATSINKSIHIKSPFLMFLLTRN